MTDEVEALAMKTPPPPAQDPDGRWVLDKHIPIAVVVLLTGQLIASVWYASKLDSRVSALEDRFAEVKALDMSSRMIRMEERTAATLQIVQRIENWIEMARRPMSPGSINRPSPPPAPNE